jgi:hypothetical protein
MVVIWRPPASPCRARLSSLVSLLPALFASLSSALAQDFGRKWLDEVSHAFEEEDQAPLASRPLEVGFLAGQRLYFDDNVFLEESGRNSDFISVTYGRATLSYAEEQFDAAADVLVNYSHFFKEQDASSGEERVFGRARYVASDFSAEVAEVLRNENVPIDILFTDRVDRLVSNTLPRVRVYASTEEHLALEADGNFQFVRFHDSRFSHLDNLNYRAAFTVIHEMAGDLELGTRAGLLGIDYDPSFATDTKGWFLQAGARGELLERVHTQLLAGVSRARAGALEKTVFDADLHVRFEATERLSLLGDFTRRFGFAGDGSPFEVVTQAAAIAQAEVDADLKLSGRLQVEHIQTALGLSRDYLSTSVMASYLVRRDAGLDAGITFRAGDVSTGGLSGEFTNLILWAGIELTF